MQEPKKVTVIPANVVKSHGMVIHSRAKLRVAAYARVSTDSEEQQNSYAAQVRYYTEMIQANPEWEFASIFTDEGTTGTSTKKRDGFNLMIQEALAGKIDMIITKTVSRFARNTVDSLLTVRQLKEQNIAVYFESQNINTLDSNSELMLTLLSSLAQEESRSISENVRWGIRKSFSDGNITLPYKQFLGYEKGADGRPSIVESEAKIVRLIYKLYLLGMSQSKIAKYLTDKGIPSPGGKRKWHISTVVSILLNEKYRGDALLQKNYTVDFLTKKKKKNEGEIPQYYVEKSHPAIIEPDVFDLVQYEMQRRKESPYRQSSNSCLSNKIMCGECGYSFGPKTWHSNSKYARIIWQCLHKYKKKGEEPCPTPHLYEKDIQRIFVRLMQAILPEKQETLTDCREAIAALYDTGKIESDIAMLEVECSVILEQIQKLIDENAAKVMKQEVFHERFDVLDRRQNATSEKIEAQKRERIDRKGRKQEALRFFEEIEKQDGLLETFDPQLWNIAIRQVTVFRNGDMVFILSDGSEHLIKA